MLLLRKYVEAYTDQYKKASEDVQAYVESPINAYLLVKRLTTDLEVVQDLIITNTESISDIDKLKPGLKFPSDEDLNGAAMALARLQDTYKLDTSSLANGEINGVKCAAELTAADCFELGRQSYTNADHYHAQLWMMEADERLKREVNQTVERSEILEYLAFSTYKLGDVRLALDLTNEILELIPTHERALINKDMLFYEALCRGEIKPSDEILAQLKCRYTDNGNPFLKIAPFKVEEAYLDPKILIFHDVMADNEIATIKALARPHVSIQTYRYLHLNIARVKRYTTDALNISNYRISKSAWLKEIDHKHVADVVQRVEDMTGLSMETAENLQVVNYGIGGHFWPHYDFATKGDPKAFNRFERKRIATVLFYMSDVAQGGATVFPYLNIAVWPKKGTAAFWYNLHSSGEGDLHTAHAACPVLTGSKWGNMIKNFAIILLVLLCTKRSYSELYTALVELEGLLHTEYAVITAIHNYITAQEQKMLLLRKCWSKWYEEGVQHRCRGSGRPRRTTDHEERRLRLLATRDRFSTTRSIANDWMREFIADFDKLKSSLKFPSKEDLNGAAMGLTRLQHIYELDTSSLANGEINGVKYATELTAGDCFELGRQSYNNADYYHTQLWMTEADERLKREVNQTVERSEILEYLAFSAFKLGDLVLALDLTNKLLELIPTHKKAGEIRPSDEILAELKCRYVHNGNPFLKIAPFKVEEAYLDPQILIFHDVMADHEIATIKALARPHFQRAIVQNFTTGTSKTANYRISKTAWLIKTIHEHIKDVVQRVGDMTGLTIKSAEDLQVVNYGIGGHYEPHYDFAKKEEFGNRIATVLFYMSDVAQGGTTAFVNLKVAVRPKKGTAVFWYNLHSSGEGDSRTLHAACPILTGSKWGIYVSKQSNGNMIKNFAIILLVLLCTKRSYSELYTALVELEGLLHTEYAVITAINNYVTAQEQKMLLLRKYYFLQFIADFDELKGSLKFPSDEDLNGAAVALTRLQKTYKLDTSSLANGEINGVKYATELTAADCFELGRQSYTNDDHYHTQLWMMEAAKRLKLEVNQSVERSKILEYLAFSTFKLGDVRLALDLTNKLLELVPTHEKALNNKVYYEVEIVKTKNIFWNRQAKLFYEALCREEMQPSDEILAELKCGYMDNGNPFLKIAPFKVEEAYLDPQILIFHDVMADDEIATIKALAQPRFQRAVVQNFTTGVMQPSSYRIGKVAWLKETEHKHVADVVQRVEDMTGLTMKTAEDLQVLNYGIGGHYEPHYDFARKGEKNGFKDLGTGNRIATVLFYVSQVENCAKSRTGRLDIFTTPHCSPFPKALIHFKGRGEAECGKSIEAACCRFSAVLPQMSDVDQGGATVFIDLDVVVRPKKGTAVFWYNLHSNGEGDRSTGHAACPVLAGSKWVSNKWIHEDGQLFRRPCELERPPPEYTI
ncbi:prolyl 4-hydroxylase alpha subunit [Holotrichia oblita]|uniref:Prolyl 4-hydroxylase alpha subunit n=1 Tax=Holotrichia oblita TaxID=644536 RepID=A0ACB9SWN0_HOLOL|nr:prolyl 4-hydroxylase alpha subunit [Holotrichia oblita]